MTARLNLFCILFAIARCLSSLGRFLFLIYIEISYAGLNKEKIKRKYEGRQWNLIINNKYKKTEFEEFYWWKEKVRQSVFSIGFSMWRTFLSLQRIILLPVICLLFTMRFISCPGRSRNSAVDSKKLYCLLGTESTAVKTDGGWYKIYIKNTDKTAAVLSAHQDLVQRLFSFYLIVNEILHELICWRAIKKKKFARHYFSVYRFPIPPIFLFLYEIISRIQEDWREQENWWHGGSWSYRQRIY